MQIATGIWSTFNTVTVQDDTSLLPQGFNNAFTYNFLVVFAWAQCFFLKRKILCHMTWAGVSGAVHESVQHVLQTDLLPSDSMEECEERCLLAVVNYLIRGSVWKCSSVGDGNENLISFWRWLQSQLHLPGLTASCCGICTLYFQLWSTPELHSHFLWSHLWCTGFCLYCDLGSESALFDKCIDVKQISQIMNEVAFSWDFVHLSVHVVLFHFSFTQSTGVSIMTSTHGWHCGEASKLISLDDFYYLSNNKIIWVGLISS